MQAAAVNHDRLALRLPVRATSVGIGRSAAAQFAEEAGCDPATLWRVRLSVSEAISNVVLHAHPPDQEHEHHLALVAEADASALQVTISDEGHGLRSRADSPGMGLGLGLIASSCDEFVLDTGEHGGTIVRMTFSR
jgi:anti-sigma regulatory factor (Ser/Thr protein kinase)